MVYKWNCKFCFRTASSQVNSKICIVIKVSLFRFMNQYCTAKIILTLEGTIASKINVTLKDVRLSEKLQHSVMKFDSSNKFDLCYY